MPLAASQKTETHVVPHTALEALQQAEERVKNAVRMSGDYRTAFAELTSALVQFWGKVATSQTAPHTHERPASSQTGDTADTTNKKEALTAEGTKLAHEEASLQEKLAELRAHVFRLDTQLANQKLVAVEGEREVLEQFASGASNKEAGRTLGISPRTIEDHRANIMKKLGARNAADLIRIVMTAAQRAS
jgi:DNA-binding CsgD family transcriptional regulator